MRIEEWRIVPGGMARVGRPAAVLAMLLLVDLLLIGLFLRWAYAAHHRVTDSLFFGTQLFSFNEGGLVELWGFGKLGAATCLVAAAARARGGGRAGGFYASLAALMLVMLLADALQVHERLAALGSSRWGGGASAQYLDPLIKAGLAMPPLLALTLSYPRLPRPERPVAALAVSPVLALGCVAGAVDVLHSMWVRRFGSGRTWSTLVEEGGEAVLASLTLAAALLVWCEARAQASARSASPI